MLASPFRATLPFVLDGSKRGRPPKDARAALGLVAAFKVELCKQREAGYPENKGLARERLGYAERSARTALTAAQKKIDQLFPTRTWSVVFLPHDPFEHVGLPRNLRAGACGACGLVAMVSHRGWARFGTGAPSRRWFRTGSSRKINEHGFSGWTA